MLGQTKLTLRHRLHELFGLLGETLRHFLRFFRSESLQLIEERHLLDFFLRVLLYFRPLARNFGFVNFRFAFCREIGAGAHGQCRSKHSRKARYENVMLLIICRAGHA